MTKTRMFMFAAIAVIVAFGVGGHPALAAAPQFHRSVIGHVPAQVSPDTTGPTILQLVTTLGTLAPIDGSGNYEWPCLTGDPINWPDCSSIPAGGLVIGLPTYTVSLANCLDPTVACIGGVEVVEDDNPSTTKNFNWGLRITTGRCRHSGHRSTRLWPKYAEYNSIHRRQRICRSGELRHRNLCSSGCREGHGHNVHMGGHVGGRRPCHHQLPVIDDSVRCPRGAVIALVLQAR